MLKDAAEMLEISPAHLVDLEKGRRTPSEELLMRIVEAYDVQEAILRAGWTRPHPEVLEMAAHDPVAVDRVRELLEITQDFTPEQWDQVIETARELAPAPEMDGPELDL